MTFLPVVSRELRVAARRRGTHLGRVAAAAVAVLIAAWGFLTWGSLPFLRPQLGAMIFGSLTFFAFVYCLLIGTRATADCLSQEKREGTLGLLFLTDLKGYDVVLGKLAARSLGAFYGLLAAFPVMAIPVLLGGVSGTDLVRTAALLLNTLFFSLAAGMFASSVAQNERRALALTVLLIAGVAGGLPLLGLWWTESVLQNRGALPPWWTQSPSPCVAYALIRGGADKFWLSLGTTHALGWALLGAACLILPRAWQERARSARSQRWWHTAARLLHGDADRRAARRRQLLERHPVVWLCSRHRMDAPLIWAALLAGALIWGWGLWRGPEDWLEPSAYVLTALVLHVGIKAWIAHLAVRQIAEDRRMGALELLLATPLSHREIVQGHLRALRRLFGGPLAAVLAADAAFAVGSLLDGLGPGGTGTVDEENWTMFWLFAGSMGTLVADAWALGWLGLWFGLTKNRANRAASAAVWRVVFLPGIVMWFGGMPLALAGNVGGGPQTFLVLWFVLGLVNAGVWYGYAERRLMEGFREAAARRFDAPRPGWLKQLFGRGTATRPPVITELS